LFAVMILGVGFIMVAAIFPVAIQQAKTSTEETSAAAISRGAATYIDGIATNSILPGTGNVLVGPDFDGLPPDTGFPIDRRDGRTLATALRGSVVVPADSRYAWVPFYRRAGNPRNPESWGPFAQIIMVPVLMRAESDFSGVTGPPNNPLSKGGPLLTQHTTAGIPGTARLTGSFFDGVAGNPDTVVFKSTVPADLEIPSEGAYLIISDATNLGAAVAATVNGFVYRLGNRVEGTPDTWELMPGFDLDVVRIDGDASATNGAGGYARDGKEILAGAPKSISGGVPLTDVQVFVIGRSLDPNEPSGALRTGTAQDVTAYTTFVSVK
jgi:hypothetical protein